MPRLKSETFGAGDQSWLGSAHGVRNARTVTIDISAFTSGTHYPDGYIPSGTPVAIVSNLAVPYDKTEGTTTGAGTLAGFILTDQPVVGTTDFPPPLPHPGLALVTKVPPPPRTIPTPTSPRALRSPSFRTSRFPTTRPKAPPRAPASSPGSSSRISPSSERPTSPPRFSTTVASSSRRCPSRAASQRRPPRRRRPTRRSCTSRKEGVTNGTLDLHLHSPGHHRVRTPVHDGLRTV